MIPPPPSHHQPPPTAAAAAAAAAAYWPYLYTRCNPATATSTNVSRRKGGQIRFSAEQSLQLEKKFETSQYLSPVERKQIAKSLHLSERQVRKFDFNLIILHSFICRLKHGFKIDVQNIADLLQQ